MLSNCLFIFVDVTSFSSSLVCCVPTIACVVVAVLLFGSVRVVQQPREFCMRFFTHEMYTCTFGGKCSCLFPLSARFQGERLCFYMK